MICPDLFTQQSRKHEQDRLLWEVRQVFRSFHVRQVPFQLLFPSHQAKRNQNFKTQRDIKLITEQLGDVTTINAGANLMISSAKRKVDNEAR